MQCMTGPGTAGEGLRGAGHEMSLRGGRCGPWPLTSRVRPDYSSCHTRSLLTAPTPLPPLGGNIHGGCPATATCNPSIDGHSLLEGSFCAGCVMVTDMCGGGK